MGGGGFQETFAHHPILSADQLLAIFLYRKLISIWGAGEVLTCHICDTGSVWRRGGEGCRCWWGPGATAASSASPHSRSRRPGKKNLVTQSLYLWENVGGSGSFSQTSGSGSFPHCHSSFISCFFYMETTSHRLAVFITLDFCWTKFLTCQIFTEKRTTLSKRAFFTKGL
jgi:hypothetical protein